MENERLFRDVESIKTAMRQDIWRGRIRWLKRILRAFLLFMVAVIFSLTSTQMIWLGSMDSFLFICGCALLFVVLLL